MKVAARLGLGVASAGDIAQVLGVSQATLSRAIRALERDHRVLRMGTTRGARYALHRAVDAIGFQWPLYRIDEEGTPQELGPLHALARDMYCVTRGPPRIQQLTEGLPYFLQDARPAGFLGRAVPTTFPGLALPVRVDHWNDDHVLTYLTKHGTDLTGDLILGAEALNAHLAGLRCGEVVTVANRHTAYPAFATAAMAGNPPGFSAQGEHPKFTALVGDGVRRTHVIVKFSPPRSTPAGQRWADLLTAEYLAHKVLAASGVPACQSALFEYADRVFLQCERFDRVGEEGRRGTVSLFALDSSRYGRLDTWSASAQRLLSDALLSPEDAERIRLLDAYGALTANTDRHFGNITLFDRYKGMFKLAPVYDMLPMLLAPKDDQIIARQFEPAPPTAAWLSVWPQARTLAQTYWERLVDEPRLSADFKAICASCLGSLRSMSRRGVGSPPA